MCTMIGEEALRFHDLILNSSRLNEAEKERYRQLLEKATADVRDDVERMIAGETVLKEINENLTYNDLYSKIDNVWSVLFTTGYLTRQEEAVVDVHQLGIPNREIHNIFMTQIRAWIRSDRTMKRDMQNSRVWTA